MSIDSKWFFVQVVFSLIVGSINAWGDIRPSYGSASSTVRIPSGYIDYPNIGTAYKFHRDRRTWNEAKRICISEGGRLAVIDGFNKVDQLTSVVEYTRDVWIGLSKNGSQWLAIDGSTPVQIPWGSHQPVYSGDCAVFRTTSRGVFNTQCSWQEYFLCEIITGRTTNSGSNQLYPDLRQIFNPSYGNSSNSNFPPQRNPSYGNNPSYNNPTQRNPSYGSSQPPYGNPSYGSSQPPYGNPSYGSSQPPYGNPSYNNPTQRNPSWGNHYPGNPSYGNNPSHRNSSYQNPTHNHPTQRTPSYGGYSQVNPSYGTQSPINPSYGNPSYRNPSYGNPSYGTQSPVNPSYENPSYGNNTRRYRSTYK